MIPFFGEVESDRDKGESGINGEEHGSRNDGGSYAAALFVG